MKKSKKSAKKSADSTMNSQKKKPYASEGTRAAYRSKMK